MEQRKDIQRNNSENVPNVIKDINLQNPECEQTPKIINPNKSMPGHIIKKISENKRQTKTLKEVSEK